MALAEGGVVVFYTDGVTDAINEAEEQFGQAPLTEVIVQKWDLTAQGLTERIDEEAAAFVSGEPRLDNLTLVVLEMRL